MFKCCCFDTRFVVRNNDTTVDVNFKKIKFNNLYNLLVFAIK